MTVHRVELVTTQPHYEVVYIDDENDPANDKFWVQDRAYDVAFDLLGWDEVDIVSVREATSGDV